MVLILLLLLSILLGAIHYPPIQTYLAKQGTDKLSQMLGTKVTVAAIDVNIFSHLVVKGIYAEDQRKDTLLYVGELEVRLTDLILAKNKPTLHYLGLNNAHIKLIRPKYNPDWNFDYLIKIFEDTSASPNNSRNKPFEFNLEEIELHDFSLNYDDYWRGENIDVALKELQIQVNALEMKQKKLSVKDLFVDGLTVSVAEFDGTRPLRLKPPQNNDIDTTPFNTDHWQFFVKNSRLKDSRFLLKADDDVPISNLFDENHLDVQHIQATTKDVRIVNDTITGSILSFTAKERCGLEVKSLRCQASVSPIATICKQLRLETNHSVIGDYYAMHYSRFPDFLEYIDKVTMVGKVNAATIDTRDIAYFAPELSAYPTVLALKGEGKGTVARLAGKNIVLSDGTNVLKADFALTGLPDIYKTLIDVTNLELYATDKGIYKYAPQLKGRPEYNFDSVQLALFKGTFKGYVEDFNVKGTLTSNLGALTTDFTLKIPNFDATQAQYSGTLSTQNLRVGTLFNQSFLGALNCNEHFEGKSFKLDEAQINIDGKIDAFKVYDYTYHNLLTNGTLAKKRFDGTLWIDDPNLAMEFEGSLDYRGKDININANAHLLFANFKALQLTKDSITAAADLKLDFTGNNIDNFTGFARLYNIDLMRNAHQVDVDSIAVEAEYTANGGKELTLRSNDIIASVSGNYTLSRLPASVQYYLYQYIPNYIKMPLTFPSAQNFSFKIQTKHIDSLLAISVPLIKGFNNAQITGQFNTDRQKLTFNGFAPFGAIGNFKMNNIQITSEGTLEGIKLNTSVKRITIGDSMLNSSLWLSANVSRDSLQFRIQSQLPDSSSSMTLNGEIIARKDSLFLSLLPSELYLNRNNWFIPNGCKVAYSANFLDITGFALHSGLQNLKVNSTQKNGKSALQLETERLDIAQLGNLIGISSYMPDGRINGQIVLEDLFNTPVFYSNLRGTNVKLGADTIGTINLIGKYDVNAQLLNLDPQSGIYRGLSSVKTFGIVSFDSASTQKLDGQIDFHDAKAAWASPFLTGILSKLEGDINGSIGVSGTAEAPVVSGTLALSNSGFKVDYMGTSYKIPTALISVNNREIKCTNVEAFDDYKNKALLTANFRHRLFTDFNMYIKATSPKLEVLKLNEAENSLFYGNLIASADSFTIKGPFNNIKMHAYNVFPAAKSHVYIPISYTGDISTYSYVSFKSYGKQPSKTTFKNKDKLDIKIDANFNPLLEMTIVLDPSTGDAINTLGSGNIQMSIPPGNDIRITGVYKINSGTYDLTFKQLFYQRQFKLSEGSTINFIGPFFETEMNVNAFYPAKVRLYDLLTATEKRQIQDNKSEVSDGQAPQILNVLLKMRGTIKAPLLSFDLDLQDKRSVSTTAYSKLNVIKQDDRQKFEQVASLLLFNALYAADPLATTVGTGAFNNFSQILSSTASTGITSFLSKLIGDKKLNVDVKYNSYNLNSSANATNQIGLNRNQVKLGVSHPFFNDKLTVELGGTSDWGKQSSNSNSNVLISPDFRIQYSLSNSNTLQLEAFKTSDYDITNDKRLQRGGIGLSWRKSFDNLGDLFRPFAYKPAPPAKVAPKDTVGKRK